MSRVLFIADLHLSPSYPAVVDNFLSFLRLQATDCDALYILGDLFEVWVGDDDVQPFYQPIADALCALTCPVFYLHGNRDFLLGKAWAQRNNIVLLPQETVIQAYGQKILIMHGDTLCTDDVAYQKYRRFVHQQWLQKAFLALPLVLRRGIANRMRSKSRQTNQHKNASIMDVNALTVDKRMQAHQVTLLIHGHTHRPAVHTLNIAGGCALRAVLGDWHPQGSMIVVDGSGLRLENLPLPS